MPYGNKATEPSRIYAYRARKPEKARLGLVFSQLRLAHRYRNQLVEIELKRRQLIKALNERFYPGLADIEAELADTRTRLKDLRLEIRQDNIVRRKRGSGTPGQKAEIKMLGTRKKELIVAKKELKAVAYANEQHQRRLKKIDALILTQQKAARKAISSDKDPEKSLFWGTYLAVEQGIATTRGKGKLPPAFRPWRGDAKLVIQLQKNKGLTFEEALSGKNTYLWIEETVPGSLRTPEKPSKKKSRQPSSAMRAVVHMVIAGKQRNLIRVKIPVMFHRKFPEGCRIKWVYLLCRRVGCTYRWTVQFVVARKEGFDREPGKGTAIAGLDVGWRVRPNGLRIGWLYSRDENGKILEDREILIESKDVDRWLKADSLRSIRDREFNTLKAWYRKNRKRLPKPGNNLDWLQHGLRYLQQCKAQAKTAALVVRWRSNRFAGDGELFKKFEEWRQRDRHLLQWEANNRRKAIAWRDSEYRNFANKLRDTYKLIAIEDANWKQVIQKRKAEEDENTSIIKVYRPIAAVGRLRQILRDTLPVLEASTAWTTQTCPKCGKRTKFDAAAELIKTCKHCGYEDDQDRVAGINLFEVANSTVAAER